MKLFNGIILFLFFGHTFAQTPTLTLLKGKINFQIKGLNDVNVTNLRSESTAITDTNGNFSIFVKSGDVLRFSSIQIVTKEVEINDGDLTKQLYVVSIEPKINQLDEVEIKKYNNINAVSLGILQKPAKTYTPAERKLRAAGEFHWYSPLLIPIGGMSVDGLINAISGRTKMLKKELEVEKKEKLLEKIENTFHEDYFLENLKIPKDYLRGFWYYAIENEKLISALNDNNKMMARFIFSDLSVKYREIISNKY